MRQVAIVTGASKGIGSAISEYLAKNGYEVALLARNFEQLSQLEKRLLDSGLSAKAIACDVSSFESIDKALKQVDKHFGSPDILVNNAGLGGPFHRTDEVSAEEWRQIFATNIDGVYYLSKKVLPKMKAKSFGRIVNISSIQGLVGASLSSTYVATKHAVIGYTKAIATEWGRYGITCNAICPGFINTDMLKNHPDEALKKNLLSRIPASRFGEPEEIAALTAFLVGPQSSYINGGIFTVDGGLTAHADLNIPQF